MEEKIISTGESTVERFLCGVNKIDELVGGTLGPAGRNRIIQRKYRSPLVTNDGVTIARHAYLKDEIEDLAAQTLVEIAMKTNETAGDGTTTSIVIASQLIRSCMEKIREAGPVSPMNPGALNPMKMSREIQREAKKAIEMLEKQKHELEGEEIDNVISTSLEDLEYGKKLGEVLRAVGKDGYISTEDNWGTKYGIDTELVNGMRFLGSYASPYLATERNQKEAVWEDTCVLVTNEKIEAITALSKVLVDMKREGKTKLVIIDGYSENTSAFSKDVIREIGRSMRSAATGLDNKGNPIQIIQVLLVKAPTLTSDELEDVAVFCDAKFFNKERGDHVRDAMFMQLGHAKRIVVNEDDVNIIGGRGNTEQRIEVLREQIEREKDPMFEEKTKRRIASLSAGVGIIRVGAATEQERTYLKYKLEDAVHAAKAALEEGVVPGGGLALKAVAEEMGKENILFEALMAPFNRIRSNAGVDDMEVPETIVDPHKVVRLAFTNAISAASALITCDGAIADRKLTVLDYFEKKLGKLNPSEDDFRDAKNQDLGRGRHVD